MKTRFQKGVIGLGLLSIALGAFGHPPPPPRATEASALAGVNNNQYMTPFLVQTVITAASGATNGIQMLNGFGTNTTLYVPVFATAFNVGPGTNINSSNLVGSVAMARLLPDVVTNSGTLTEHGFLLGNGGRGTTNAPSAAIGFGVGGDLQFNNGFNAGPAAVSDLAIAASTPSLSLNPAVGATMTLTVGSGQALFDMSAGVYDFDGTVDAASGFRTAGSYAGNGSGLSNAVDIIAGTSITVSTGANNRSFTINSTASGSAVPFTNAPFGYGDVTNVGSLYTTQLLVTASLSAGSTLMIGSANSRSNTIVSISGSNDLHFRAGRETNNFASSNSIFTVYDSAVFNRTIAGHGSGVSNAVDIIAGSNITVQTNANNRSFTIAATSGIGSETNFISGASLQGFYPTTASIFLEATETQLSLISPDAVNTININNASGVVIAGTLTVPNDSIALGTKTTGNYAAGDAEAGGATTLRATAGSATLSSAQVSVNTTGKMLGIHNGTKEVALPLIEHREYSFDPDAICDGAVDRLFLFKIGPWAPNGITITGWRISFEADPTTEVDLDLKRADAFIGVANSAVMDVLDTTTGAASETTAANINGGAVVANGKVVYLEFGTAYTETTHQIIFEIEYEIEED